jgi:hypothetical protein
LCSATPPAPAIIEELAIPKPTMTTSLTICSQHNNHSPIDSMMLPMGRQQTAKEIFASIDPRQDWRGFSFGGYWFSYYYFYFSNASPSSAARQMMPG